MTTGPAGNYSAEDAEVIRLAKTRLVKVCRLNAAGAEQALARGAAEQKVALVSVAMRVLAAIPADLAAGRVVPLGRTVHPGPARQGPYRPNRPNRPHQQQGKKPFKRGGRRYGKRD
jgi:hypothetical protein